MSGRNQITGRHAGDAAIEHFFIFNHKHYYETPHLATLVLTLLASTMMYRPRLQKKLSPKHLGKHRGKEKLSSITSLKMETNATIMGNEAAGYTLVLNGRVQNETNFNSSAICRLLRTRGCRQPDGRRCPGHARRGLQIRKGRHLYLPLPRLRCRGRTVTLAGREKWAMNALRLLTNAESVDQLLASIRPVFILFRR